MKYILRITFLILCFTNTQFSSAQLLTQTIRGTVVDLVSQSPLPGANVVLLNSEPFNGTATDMVGNFQLKHVPVGKQNLRITFLGYKEYILPNITVTSGKEVVLSIALEENVVMGKEVTITDKIEKNKPLNEYSTVSARTFSVEETQKYAAAVNDPARMSTSYAGVVSTDDGNNAITIRGNSPNGLLWRMEGVEIPNPNHFSNVGTSGGGISILSSQVLTNSDFMTGAFPAEYGNALSGVFDLKLRRGNNQKSEQTIQVGFLGTDLAVEGPFKKGYDGSYLINYRYSTLSVLGKLGVNVGTATTNFQDLSYNFYLPTKKSGTFTLFGFGGLSSQSSNAEKDSLKWTNYYDKFNWDFTANTGATGLTHFIQLDNRTYLKTSLVASGTGKTYKEEELDTNYEGIPQGELNYGQNKIALNSILTRKINSKHSFKVGVIGTEIFYNLLNTELVKETGKIETWINQKGETMTLQSFAQWNYRATEKLTFNAGLHYLLLAYNKTASLEPRASLKVDLNSKQSLSFGFGMHSQLQPIGVYFARNTRTDGTVYQPNKDLELTKALHYVLSYDRSLTDYLRLKLEGYYQQLYNVPVSTDINNTFSILNSEGGYTSDPLANNGKGKNYGVELTFEQFLHHDFYFLLSSSVYDSKYKAANGKWFNTRFNGNFATTFTAGKEFKTGSGFKNRIIGVNIKTIYAGGLRNTPIDIDASKAKGETVYRDVEAFSLQAKDYFRTDVKFSLKRNRLKSTVTWSVDIQNVSNAKNIFGDYFDPLTGTTKTSYQAPLIPILSYKVDF